MSKTGYGVAPWVTVGASSIRGSLEARANQTAEFQKSSGDVGGHDYCLGAGGFWLGVRLVVFVL
jgi:hypothetical protein